MAKNSKNKILFNPCDQHGKVVSRVLDANDFREFCLFMSDQSEQAKALRKAAYDALSETGEATPKAKIDFVREVSLDYFKLILKNGNSLSAQALASDASPWDDEVAEKFVSAMGKEFRGLLVAVGADVFDGMLTATSMTPQAKSALVKALWSGDEFAKNIVSIALKAQAGEGAKAIAAWKQTPEARAQMTSRVSVQIAADRISLHSKYGVYAPLLKYLTEQMQVAERAEYFARFEDYANSGFFDLDLSLAKSARTDGLLATPAAHAWKRMADLVMSGQEPQPNAQDVRDALNERLAEVGKNLTVSGVKNGKNQTFKAKTTSLSAKDLEGRAGKGIVDSFTQCSDGTARVTFATSKELANTQNDQWARHFIAVESSLPELGLKSASYRILAPCIVADRATASSAVAVGAPLSRWFAGSKKLGDELHGAINAAPFLTELMCGAADVLATAKSCTAGEWAAKLELDLFGSEKNAWPAMRDSISKSANPEMEFRRQLMGACGILMDGLAQGAKALGAMGRTLSGVASMDKAGPQMALIVDLPLKTAMFCITGSDPELSDDAKKLKAKIDKVLANVELGHKATQTLMTASGNLGALGKKLASDKKKASDSQASVAKSAKKK